VLLACCWSEPASGTRGVPSSRHPPFPSQHTDFSLGHGGHDKHGLGLVQPSVTGLPPSGRFPGRRLQQTTDGDGGGHYTLTVQVRLEAARLPGSKLRLVLRLERETSPDDESPGTTDAQGTGGPWITWATAPERTVPLSSEGVPEVSDTLSEVERRYRTGEVPQFSNERAALSLVFNEEFKNLLQGTYRAALLDLDTCISPSDCAVLAYSNTQELQDGRSWLLAYTGIDVTYGAIELGLRFTRCAYVSQCRVPAQGVEVTTTVTDIRGRQYWPTLPRAVDDNGYLFFGTYLGLSQILHFGLGEQHAVSLRNDYNLMPNSTKLMRNLGVLDAAERSLLCAPSSPNNPRQQLISGQGSGLIPQVAGTVYTPSLNCYWQIIPQPPAKKVTIQFLHVGQSLGDGSQLQIYTLSTKGDVVPVYNVRGFTSEPLEVEGSQILLHFSALPSTPAEEAFYMAWSVIENGVSTTGMDNWFGSRVATILFSTLAATAYCIAGIAAWKWWRQRLHQQQEESSRQAAREAQRNEARRHRNEGRRRRTRGLPVELVSRLPTSNIKLAELDRDGDDEPSCSICLCEYEEDDRVTWLPCSHSYHTSCVVSWLKNSLICPICKDNVKRSLLKTLSLYRELHRNGPPSDAHVPGDVSVPLASPHMGSTGPADAIEMTRVTNASTVLQPDTSPAGGSEAEQRMGHNASSSSS